MSKPNTNPRSSILTVAVTRTLPLRHQVHFSGWRQWEASTWSTVLTGGGPCDYSFPPTPRQFFFYRDRKVSQVDKDGKKIGRLGMENDGRSGQPAVGVKTHCRTRTEPVRDTSPSVLKRKRKWKRKKSKAASKLKKVNCASKERTKAARDKWMEGQDAGSCAGNVTGWQRTRPPTSHGSHQAGQHKIPIIEDINVHLLIASSCDKPPEYIFQRSTQLPDEDLR